MQIVGARSEFAPAARPSMGSDASDKDCIRAIARGDRRAMNQLFLRHNVRVYRFILRLTGSETVAEELVSEVFLDAWRQAGRFEARSLVSTWLLAIARNKAISAMRRRQDSELDEDALARVEDPSENPEQVLEKNERASVLRKCLSQLSPAHREIIDLVYYHEKSVEEAAAITGVPAGTVKTRMYYARQQLAALVEKAESGRLLS
jgi:RNA polymerase sigma-70 factor (ECF subfamily)